MLGSVKRSSNPLTASKAERRIAPQAPQNVKPSVRALVDVVVQQVLVLREHVLLGRRVVVAADQGADARIVVEARAHPVDRVGLHGDVGVDEEEHGAAGGRRADVACPRGTSTCAGPLHTGADRLRRRGFAVLGAIDDDDDLTGGGIEPVQGAEAGLERLTAPVHGHQHRDVGGRDADSRPTSRGPRRGHEEGGTTYTVRPTPARQGTNTVSLDRSGMQARSNCAVGASMYTHGPGLAHSRRNADSEGISVTASAPR